MSKLETPLTRAYWDSLGDGTLYEELRVTHAVPNVQSWRDVDGVVVLGEHHRIASPGERTGVSLDGRDVIVIQTKATRLNPYVFGQALLSMDLIRMRWDPRSLRSVIICTDDDPELSRVISAFPDIELRVARSEQRGSFRLSRLPGAAADLASQRGVALLQRPRLTPSFRIDGLIVPSYDPSRQRALPELVAGQTVNTVHSEASGGRTATLGMWMSGEVIAAQHLLLQMGAAAVHSLVICRHDQAIEAALRRHASFEIIDAGPAGPISPKTTSAAGKLINLPAEPEGWRRASRAVIAATAQEFIPGHYCRLCGWPFTHSQRRTQCQVQAACERRQQVPLHLRAYGCPYNDRVHPEWRDLQRSVADLRG